MSFLTFDNDKSDQSDFSDLQGTNLPDEIECGENNKFWVKARRKSKVMILVDKETGKVLKKVEIDQPEFERIAASYGVGPRQIGAVNDALRLK